MGGEELFLAVLAMVGVAVLAYPLIRAIADRIRPRSDGGLGLREDVLAVREDLGQELRDLRREVAELGERVDFAERLLAKQREAPRLGGGT